MQRSGAESIAFENESHGDVGKVRRHVINVTLGYVLFFGGVMDFAELGFTRVARGR